MGRKRTAEKVAATYRTRLDVTRVGIDAELGRGDLRAALRILLGFAEDVAMSFESARRVSLLRAERRLTPAQYAAVQEAWRKAVLDVMGEVGLFLPEKRS
jgi:hypothetical protein